MLILLSPAKTMTGSSPVAAPDKTVPAFEKEAAELALYLSQSSVEDLSRILKVNTTLAAGNYRRFKEFHSADVPSLQAVLAYTGIVFKYLNPAGFTEADFHYAQSHLRFTSFLYGLLRPLDGIKCYRLEGDVRLPELNGLTMFEYWRSRLTDKLIEDCRSAGGILVNLASAEMKLLFDWKRLTASVQVVTPEFRIPKNGKLTTVVIYTKMARGEMSRMILKERLGRVEDLKKFCWEGFMFRPDLSDSNVMMFVQEGV